MTEYNLALFGHIIGAALLFGAIGIQWRSLRLVRTAQTVEQARAWMLPAKGLDKVFPICSLILLVSGGYMAEKVWGWDVPWINVSFVTVILMSLTGKFVNGPRFQALGMALGKASAGPLPADVSARINDPVLWTVAHVLAFSPVGLVYVMVFKPGLNESVAALLTSVVFAIAVSAPWAQVRAGREAALAPSRMPAVVAEEA